MPREVVSVQEGRWRYKATNSYIMKSRMDRPDNANLSLYFVYKKGRVALHTATLDPLRWYTL